MKRELNNKKLTIFALVFQTGLAYVLALITNQIGSIIFKGTQAMNKITLDNSKLESASESAESIVNADIYGYVALATLAILILVAMYTQFFRKETE